MIRVIVVDDHPLIRQGLVRIFEREPDFAVVGEAGSLAEGIAVVERVRADVLLADVVLPDGSGMDLVRHARGLSVELGIVVLTMHGEDEKLFEALDAGASAFVLKSSGSEEILAAVRHAAASPLAFTAADLALAMRRRMAPPPTMLTEREQQVLDLLKEGYSVAGVARTLYISESTAKTHIAKLYTKLGASNRAQAVMAAVRLGLVAAAAQPA